jgi:hypothetical protein
LASAVTDLLLEELGHELPPILRIHLSNGFPHKYGVTVQRIRLPHQIAAAVAQGTQSRQYDAIREFG